MPRPPRTIVVGIYHLASHASDTRHLFVTADDRTTFLGRLALVSERFRLRLIAYALLGNDYHLVLATPADAYRAPSSSSTPGTRASTTAATNEARISSAPTSSPAS